MSDTEGLYAVFAGPVTITLPSEPVEVGFTITIEAGQCPVIIRQPAQIYTPIPPENKIMTKEYK